MKAKYIVTDKDGTERETHFYEILEKSGLVEKAKKMGSPILAVHDSELLRAERIEEYESAKLKHLKERDLKKLKTTEQDLNFFYYSWLLTEDKKCDNWKERSNSNSDKIEIFKYQSYVKNELKITELKINPPTEIDTFKSSYKWQGASKLELPLLFSLLMSKILISKETKQKDFIDCFSNKSEGTFKQIDWIETNALLTYFIRSLETKNRILSTDLFAIAEICFTNQKRTSLKSSETNYNNSKTGKPKGYKKIDEIVSQLP